MATDYETNTNPLPTSRFVEINPDLFSWYNQNKGFDFSGRVDPYRYQFGPGHVFSGQELANRGFTDVALNANYFRPDSRDTSRVLNVLPEYDEPEFADNAWIIPLMVAGAGLFAGAGGGDLFSGFSAGAGTEGGSMFEGLSDFLESAEFLADYDFGGTWGSGDFGQFSDALSGLNADAGSLTWRDLRNLPGLPENLTSQQRSGIVDLANNLGGLFSGGGMSSLLGSLLPGLLGWAGSNAQADAYRDVSRDYIDMARDLQDQWLKFGRNTRNMFMDIGEPYRDQLERYMANPDQFLNSRYVQRPLNQANNSVARALSTTMGNPALSGTALTEMNNYAANNLFSRFNEFAGMLGNFGNMGIGAASQANTTGANAATQFNPMNTMGGSLMSASMAGGPYNAAGFTLNNLFGGPQSNNPFQFSYAGAGL